MAAILDYQQWYLLIQPYWIKKVKVKIKSLET